MRIAHVSERGQITIPADIRKRLGIRPGSKVEIETKDDAIFLRPIPSITDVAGIFRKYAHQRPADWQTVRQHTAQSVAEQVANE